MLHCRSPLFPCICPIYCRLYQYRSINVLRGAHCTTCALLRTIFAYQKINKTKNGCTKRHGINGTWVGRSRCTRTPTAPQQSRQTPTKTANQSYGRSRTKPRGVTGVTGTTKKQDGRASQAGYTFNPPRHQPGPSATTTTQLTRLLYSTVSALPPVSTCANHGGPRASHGALSVA